MKKNVITNSKTTLYLTSEGDSSPTVIEICIPKEKILSHLKKLSEYRDVSSIEKPLLIPDRYGLKRISVNNLLYIEAERSYCTFHFYIGKNILVASPMASFENYFNNKGFIRIHKSYVVNSQYIDYIRGTTVTLTNGIKLNIGNYYRKMLFSNFTITCHCFSVRLVG